MLTDCNIQPRHSNASSSHNKLAQSINRHALQGNRKYSCISSISETSTNQVISQKSLTFNQNEAGFEKAVEKNKKYVYLAGM